MIARTLDLVPGMHTDVPAATYHAFDAVSSSLLAGMTRSMAYARWMQTAPDEPSPAMVEGSLVHSIVLEPDEAKRLYTPKAPCEALLKSGKRRGRPCGLSGSWYGIEDGHDRAFCAKHAPADAVPDGRVHVSADVWLRANQIEHAVWSHPDASALLGASGALTETTLIWTDEATGLTCKARPDLLLRGSGVICDLKRNRNAHPDRWPGEIMRRNYHVQAAHYLAGARACGLSITSWIWILVEPTPPHEVWCPMCTEDTIAAGEDLRRELLTRWAECLGTGRFPGYTGGPTTGLPEWALGSAAGQVTGFTDDEEE